MQKKCRRAKRRRQALASLKIRPASQSFVRPKGRVMLAFVFLRPYKIGEDLFFGLGLGNAGGLSGLNAF